MPSIADRLREEAQHIAEDMRRSGQGLQEEIRQLETQIANLKTQAQDAQHADARLQLYKPEIGAERYCPRCAIAEGVVATIREIASPPHEHYWRCNKCPWVVSIHPNGQR